MSWSRIALAAAGAVLLSVVAVFSVIELGKRQFTRPGLLNEAVFFDIPKGAGAAAVATSLEAQGIISGSGILPADMIFREGARHSGRATAIRFGTFEIPAGASMDEILSIITNSTAAGERYQVRLKAGARGGTVWLGERKAGEEGFTELVVYRQGDTIPDAYSRVVQVQSSIGYRVVIPEGLTSWQVVQSLSAADFLSGDPGAVPPEGILAPDTYAVERGLQRSALLQRMRESQRMILTEAWEQRRSDLPVETAEEALILASIIEKETGLADERRRVASVFVNRLRLGMPLQTDPSVIYGVTEGKAPLGRGLRQSELKGDTPYNSYLHKGLPPTPIANPGRHAIQAALNPEASKFLYFVADGTGGHAFSENYDEHRKNVRAWRKIESGKDR